MSIHQEVRINCEPAQLYGILTSSRKFASATGSKADLSDENGAAFACFDGKISGRNLELQPDELIVQAWRSGGWPEGVYSVVRIALRKDGDATRVMLDHTGLPEGTEEHIDGGWHKMYWDPLKSICE